MMDPTTVKYTNYYYIFFQNIPIESHICFDLIHKTLVLFSGFINGLSMVTKGKGGPVTVGIILLLIGLLFAFAALIDMIILIKVLAPSNLGHILGFFLGHVPFVAPVEHSLIYD